MSSLFTLIEIEKRYVMRRGRATSFHPNAYLKHRRNVVSGLKVRTKIIKMMENADMETTAGLISQFLRLSYRSSLHHLHLLEEDKIVKRSGKRPYKWALTGKGQKGIVERERK